MICDILYQVKYNFRESVQKEIKKDVIQAGLYVIF